MGLDSDGCGLAVALRIQLARPQRRIVNDIHSATADFAVHLACDFLLDEVGWFSSRLAYAGDLLPAFSGGRLLDDRFVRERLSVPRLRVPSDIYLLWLPPF